MLGAGVRQAKAERQGSTRPAQEAARFWSRDVIKRAGLPWWTGS